MVRKPEDGHPQNRSRPVLFPGKPLNDFFFSIGFPPLGFSLILNPSPASLGALDPPFSVALSLGPLAIAKRLGALPNFFF